MQVLLRLYNMEKEAADGSTIGRPVTNEYLASDDYKVVIADHLAMGGKTHKDRKVEDKYADLVGPDDQIMISDNITHYITKIYTEPDNPYCMAIVQILNPEDYAGIRKDNIQNLIGDLASGIKLPCSVVIQALWDYNNNCEKIIRIKGVDFTLNPSFEGSGTQKVFSALAPSLTTEGVKFYSKKSTKDFSNCVMKTVVFSATAEVLIEEKIMSLNQVADKYGLASKQYAFAKKEGGFFSESRYSEAVQSETQTYIELHDPLNESAKQQNPEDVNKAHTIRRVLIEIAGDEETADAILEQNPNILDLYCDDTEQLRLKLDQFIFELPEDKHYSTVNAVRDRMMYQKLPRFSLINRIFKSYKLYWEQNGDKLTESQIEFLQVMFIQDVGILIRAVLKQVIAGNNLAALYALVQFSPQLAAVGKTFSKIYRQVMISEKILGFIPQQKYLKWKKAYVDFINECIKYVFDDELRISLNGVDYITKI